MTSSTATAPSAPIGDGPRPKHVQLSDLLAESARTELDPGSAIPSERDLMARYGVSRATVRKAIDGLVTTGLLHRVQGKGTFVARPRLESRLHLASFSQDMRRRGLTPSTRILTIEEERPSLEVAGLLDLGADELVWHLHRVRLADDQPVAEENGWYAAAALPGLGREDLTGSLYELLATRYRLPVTRAEQTLWGETADATTAKRLAAPVGTPLLVFRRVSWSGTTPVEHVVSRYRGDRYELHMSLSNLDESSHSTPEGDRQ